MEEIRTKLHEIVESIENPQILENLLKLVKQYVCYYTKQKKSEEGQ